MPQYGKLRDYVSHRMTFEYDTGAKIVGYITACKPATGHVQLVVMTRVDILDATGRVLEHHEQFSFVPNALVGFRVTEGPSARDAAGGQP
jgi:recombinational DNA repair protein RecT